jgi:hypothetical protein
MANKTICVLGMARSGTSLTSMILNRLGVYFGSEQHLDAPYRFNPKGSWEHLLIREINEQIFARFGGAWDKPPKLPRGWQAIRELDDLRARAAAVLQKDFGDAPLWGYKCILTCMTLPFWQQIISDMRYVVCVRNPLDVARSLERRNGFPLEKGLLLWLLYTKAAIEHTRGQAVHFILTDQWINDGEGTLLRLAAFVGDDGQDRQTEIRQVLRRTIEKSLFDATSWAAVASVQDVYQGLSEVSDPDFNGIAHALDNALENVRPQAEQKERWHRNKVGKRWLEDSRLAIKELHELVPVEASLVLADQDELGHKETLQRSVHPFLERAQGYWGMPENETIAIDEFERMRRRGAQFIAFAWPAFWVLDCYPRFNAHLRSRFPCVLHNNRLIVFDLRRAFSDSNLTTMDQPDMGLTRV